MLKRDQSGQTLLEIIFVIGLTVIGLLGVLGVVFFNIRGADASQKMIVAANLAREGAEVTRQIRDNNWLACDQSGCNNWYDDLGEEDGEMDSSRIPAFDESDNTWTLKGLVGEINDPAAVVYFSAANGVYRQDNDPPAGFSPTIYRRLITLNQVCGNDLTGADYEEEIADDDDTCAALVGYPIQVGLKIKSEVHWSEHGRPQFVIIEDQIYNWK